MDHISSKIVKNKYLYMCDQSKIYMSLIVNSFLVLLQHNQLMCTYGKSGAQAIPDYKRNPVYGANCITRYATPHTINNVMIDISLLRFINPFNEKVNFFVPINEDLWF